MELIYDTKIAADTLIIRAHTISQSSNFHTMVQALHEANHLHLTTHLDSPFWDDVANRIVDTILEYIKYDVPADPIEKTTGQFDGIHHGHYLVSAHLVATAERDELRVADLTPTQTMEAIQALHDDMDYFINELEAIASEQIIDRYQKMHDRISKHLDWAALDLQKEKSKQTTNEPRLLIFKPNPTGTSK